MKPSSGKSLRHSRTTNRANYCCISRPLSNPGCASSHSACACTLNAGNSCPGLHTCCLDCALGNGTARED
eukprot:11535513-Alexandrium_andersonii.AAC.1